MLVSGARDRTLKLWDVPAGKCVTSVNVHIQLREVGFSPNEDLIVARGGEGNLCRLLLFRITGSSPGVFVTQ